MQTNVKMSTNVVDDSNILDFSVLTPISTRVNKKVAIIAERCLSNQLVPSKILVDADLNNLDEDEKDFVLRVGVLKLVNDYLSSSRQDIADNADDEKTATNVSSSSSSPSPSISDRIPHAIQGRNPIIWRGLSIQWHSADRKQMKPLLNFSLNDLRSLSSESKAQSEAWSSRYDFAREAIAQLTAFKKDQISSLPKKILEKLDAKCIEAWGK